MMKRLMLCMLAIMLSLGSVDMTAFASESTSGVRGDVLEAVMSEEKEGLSEAFPDIIVLDADNSDVATVSANVSGNGGGTSDAAPPVITSVILSVNEGELRIRAWSASEGIQKVSASITCISGNDGPGHIFTQELEQALGYYTSHLFIGKDITKVRVVVSALNEAGKVGYKAAQVVPVNSALESERVSNDLWIRFLDGEGEENSEYTYTGKAIKPRVEIYEGAVLLTEKKDYTLSYKNNKNAGTGLIIVKGKGNYNKNAEINFTIKPKNIGDGDIIIDDFSSVSNGKIQKKVPKIKYNKKALSNKKDKDFSVFYEDSGAGAYQEPGIYQVRIVGNGNYTGEIVTDFSVGPRLVKNLKVSQIPDMEYTGKEVFIPNLEIKDGKNLVPLELFTITYDNHVEAGTATITIKGNGIDYAGTKKVIFTITGTPLKSLITGQDVLPLEVTYNGKNQTPQPKFTFGNKELVEGIDYQTEYKNNLNVGKATMVITGKGQFTGVVKHSFKIIPFDVSLNEGNRLTYSFEGADEQGELSLPFCKSGVKPVEEVRFEGKLLTSGKDYVVSYQNNKSVTTEGASKIPKVIIKMKGNFKGSLEKTFDIYAQSLENTNITIQDAVLSSKKFSWKPKVIITDLDGKKLAAGKDYEKEITYFTDEVCENEAVEETYPVNTALWAKITGKGNYAGSNAVVSFEVKEASIAKAKVKIEEQSYTGRQVVLDNSDIISVKVAGNSLTAGEDFVILSDSYSNNISKGKAKVTLKGINRYGGIITTNFKIVAKDFRWREKLDDNQQVSLYQVVMEEAGVSEYVSKNDNILFTAKLSIEPETTATAIKINGKEYPLVKRQDGLYETKILGGDKAGSLPVEVTSVTVENEEYAVNWSGNSEVLKEAPKIENSAGTEKEDGTYEFTFDLKDEDHALMEGSRIIVTQGGQPVAEETVKLGANKISFSTEPEMQYNVSVQLNYDLDQNQDNDKNEVEGKEVYTTQITAGAQVYEVSLQNTDTPEFVEKNSELTFTTEVIVEPEADATAIKINGKNYPAIKNQNGLYEIKLPGSSNAGNVNVEVTAVTVNGKEYPVNWSGVTEVLKDVPVFENPVWNEKEDGIREFTFDLKDEDGALLAGSRVAVTQEGQTVADEEVKVGANKISFQTNPEKQYRVSVQLNYDRDQNLDNGKNKEEGKEVYTTQITAGAQVYEVSLQNTDTPEFVEKNSELTFTTEVIVEPEADATAIKINGKNYPAIKNQNGLYEIKLPGSSNAGNVNVEVTAVTVNGKEYPVNWSGVTEVLKDVPVFENPVWNEKEDGIREFTFDLKDEDGALLAGSRVVVTQEGQTVADEEVKAGANKISFQTNPEKQYRVSIQLNYDRDQNLDNGKNKEEGKEVYTTQITTGAVVYEVHLQNSAVTEFVEKNEELTFTTEISVEPQAEVTAIKINDTNYSPIKNQNGLYEIKLPGSSNAGNVNVEVTAVTVNGKEYPVNWSGKSEVLKDIPTVENPGWTEEDGSLEFTFNLKDEDDALLNGSRVVVTQNNQSVGEEEVNVGTNTISFAIEGGKEYQVAIQLTYDRDSNHNNQQNQEEGKVVYTDRQTAEVVEPEPPNPPVEPDSRELLELKDITSVILYYQGKEVQGLDISQGAPESAEGYTVKIESENAKDLYVEVEELIKENNRLRVIPKLSGFMHYEADGGEMVEKDNLLLYADNVISGMTSIEQLLDDIKNGGIHTLTEDIDASSFTAEEYSVLCDYFEGTLDGNGHTIYNLNVPLFGDLYNATVKNLTIKNARIQGKKGVLATSIQKSEVNNVKIIDTVIDSPDLDTVGGMAEYAYRGNIINCNIENIEIRAAHTIGGVVGYTANNSQITNVSVTGKLQGTRQGTEGALIGGIAGRHDSGNIKFCYSQVEIQAPAQTGNGGIIGGPSNATAGAIENSLSYARGMCNSVAGFNNRLGTISNVVQVSVPGVGKNTATGISNIDNVTEAAMTNLGLSGRAWELYEGSQKKGIDIEILSQIEGYQADRKTAYDNLNKLAYAQNTNKLVEEANALTDQELISKEIKQIYPINTQGEYVAGLILGEEENLAKILIEFTDESRKEVSLTYAYTADELVAVYESEELGITYHYDKYVSPLDISLKEELLNEVTGYQYDTKLDPLTTMADRRQYSDYYNSQTVDNLDEFISLQLISQEDYPFYVGDSFLKGKLKEELKDQLPSLLYTYNYINKWYDFEIGNVNPAKLLYFDGEKLSEYLTQEMLVHTVVGGDRSNTEQTALFYEKYLQPRIADDLYDFFESFIKVAGYTDPNEWFKSSFKGILREQNVLNVANTTGIRYRIWDNLSMVPANKSILLPILTAPQEDMILVSAPTQICLGSINRYHAANTATTKAAMEASVDTLCKWIGNYFGSIVNIVPNAREAFSNKIVVSYDTVIDFPAGNQYAGNQTEGISQEPVFKWVNEAVRKWGTVTSAAYTYDGSEIFYVNVPLFKDELGFRIFTHENAHSQDVSLFYLGNGRRAANAEFHADGVLAQEFGDGTMSFNLSRELDYNEDIIVNLSPERINTPEKLKDYYKDMFEAGYVLDYLVAQAFLQLTPAEQSKVAVKAYEYPGTEMGLTYINVTEQEIEAMNLQTIDDLVANKLSIISKENSGLMAGYYIESFWNVKWYQPHNEQGVSDEASFKGFSHEMLGYAGYEDGFVPWLSGKNKTDLDALKQITKNQNITFESYKIGRYNGVEGKLSQISWFKTDDVIKQFVEALKTDVTGTWPRYTTELKKIYYHTLKRATKDFTDGNIYEMAQAGEVSNAQQLAELLQAGGPVYIKLTNHIDLSQLPYQNGYYFENFSGIIDGNGYEIYGQKAPLFNRATYARFRNMNFDVSAIKENGGGAIISNNVKHVMIDGLNYDKSLNVPILYNSAPIGFIYREYNVIEDGSTYDSPRK